MGEDMTFLTLSANIQVDCSISRTTTGYLKGTEVHVKHTLGHENCTPVVQEIGRALERNHGVIQNARVRTEIKTWPRAIRQDANSCTVANPQRKREPRVAALGSRFATNRV
jgi:hypothetical protein